MRISRFVVGALVATAVLGGLVAAPAEAVPGQGRGRGQCRNHPERCPAPSGLAWVSPSNVADGVPAHFESIDVCPATRPDGSALQGTRKVQISIAFSFGGGMSQVVPTNPDGSWAADVTFDAGGAQDPNATANASCLDVTSTGTVIATYEPHSITVNA
jgi:hypothetical protein